MKGSEEPCGLIALFFFFLQAKKIPECEQA